MAGIKPVLTNQNLKNARQALFSVTSLLESKDIPYHLEGGTLLGIVRDNDLLPWDHDIDISIPYENFVDLRKLKLRLLFSGYKISMRKSENDMGPIRKGDYYLMKLKPLGGYIISLFWKSFVSNMVVLDIFLKRNDGKYVYWEAKGKVMRVESKYYKSHEEIDFKGVKMRVPNHYKDYLTEKYGDWSIPVKEWDCGENELTIVK